MTDFDETPLLSTLPSNTNLCLMGFAQNEEMRKFADALQDLMIELSTVMDLSRLDGVTVGYDFDAAIKSVDLGYANTHGHSYTNNGDYICVGKALNVMRAGVVKQHVVYNAGVIEQLIDPEHAYHQQAIHIIAHEFGHVAELKWRDEALPGAMLGYQSGDAVDAMLLQASLAIWEEYAACRLTAAYGDADRQQTQYSDNYQQSTAVALDRAKSAIKSYRTHADVDKLLFETGEHLAPPIKMLGYLLGHLDGLDFEGSLDKLCPDHMGTIYQPLAPQLHAELRGLWDSHPNWGGVECFDGLKALVKQAYRAAGMHIRKEGDGHYVDVPFTLDTMPMPWD